MSLILRRHGHIVSEAPGQICVHVRRFADLLSGEFHSLHRENILLLDNADKRPGVMQVVGPLCLLSVVAAGNSLCMPVEPPGGNMQDPHSLVDNLAGAGHCLSQDAAEIEDGLIQPVENEHLAPEPAAPSVDLHQDLIVRDVVEAIDIQENTEIAIDVLEGILLEFCPLPAPPGGHEWIILHGSGIDDLVFSPPFFLSLLSQL